MQEDKMATRTPPQSWPGEDRAAQESHTPVSLPQHSGALWRTVWVLLKQADSGLSFFVTEYGILRKNKGLCNGWTWLGIHKSPQYC